MITSNQPISAARAAALLLALVPGLARVELWPYWSDADGGDGRRWTGATPYDAAGRIVDMELETRREVCALLRRLGDVDLDRPQWLSVPSGAVEPVYPVAPSVPVALWDSPLADAPDAGALLEQRHQLVDAAEPPLAVADPARDLAVSLLDGHMQPAVWGARPVSLRRRSRPVTDTPAGGAL